MNRAAVFAASIAWQDHRFNVVYSREAVLFLDLHGLSLNELSAHLGLQIALADRGDTEPVQQVREYLLGERREFSVLLDAKGTPFQLDVWSETRRIPYGKTSTYGQIAAAIGRPRAARAVGAALNVNPIPIFIPCHRVIGKNGTLVGFNGGIALKEQFLALEKDEN